MDVRRALKGQYHAALAMLKQAIEECPEELWVAESDRSPAFWRVAYHTLFFTDLYLRSNVDVFRPWEHHREECVYLDKSLRAPADGSDAKPPYSKTQLLEYWAFCDKLADGAVDSLDLDAEECGFPWYNLPKLDHQINNIRHVQHHVALLAGRLRAALGADIEWVGLAEEK